MISTHRRENIFSLIRKAASSAALRVAISIICFVWTLPTLGLFISSFRPENDIRQSGWWTVFATPFDFTQWTLRNYQEVLARGELGNAFLNSFSVTIPATIIPITIAAFAAYAFAWMEFPGRDVLFAIVVGLIVAPLQMALIPILRLYTSTNLNGTFLGVWLAHTGFGMPMAIYLLYNFISQIPRDLIEAAAIDGASHFQAFITLVLPLSMPAIASFAVFQFLWVWNDLLVALVYLGTSVQVATITARLSELVGSRGQDWHLLTSGAFVSMVIPVLVFFSLQRYFVRGILAGSVKG
ncbi:MAG TPA: carbohydrate ABC transporter permease [Chloroflexi bacterium]|mgnify:CR=1 FL=1|nr:carbohydrate ABC transporter permease [Chloroflexota bacterium]